MKKVLIVSYFFPPINLIAAKRYGVMCRYLEKYGYKPYVITTYYDRSQCPDVRFDLEAPINEKQIIRIGRMNSNHGIQSICGRLLLQVMERHKLASRTVLASDIGWYEQVKRKINLEQFRDIDLVIGSFPSMGNLFVAKYLSEQLKCPYIAEIRDLISDYAETEDGYKRSRLIDRVFEKRILSGAAGIVTVTPGFRDILRKRFPNKPYKVVFNGWDEKKETRTELETDTRHEVENKYLYYAGSLYLHRLESFELLVRCIKTINLKTEDKIKFIVRSIGPRELDMMAKKIVQREQMQDYVSVLGAVSEDIVKKEQKYAYINVALSTIHGEDAALMTTIPGKVYEILNETAPVLAIVPKNSDVDKVLKYTNKGIASISEEEIIDFILKDKFKYSGNRNIIYFSRRKQAERLCKFMDQVLGDIHEKNHGGFWNKA